MNRLFDQKEVMVLALIFYFIGLLTRLVPGFYLRKLIRETDNMAITSNKFLRQCTLKYESIYKMNRSVPNTEAFVKRSLSRLTLGKCSPKGYLRFSRQALLGFVFCVGLAICRFLAVGHPVWEAFPFYLTCLAGIYTFFSVSSVCSVESLMEELHICLVEYLENHFRFRIEIEENKEEQERIKGSGPEDNRVSGEELEALLAEFLAM